MSERYDGNQQRSNTSRTKPLYSRHMCKVATHQNLKIEQRGLYHLGTCPRRCIFLKLGKKSTICLNWKKKSGTTRALFVTSPQNSSTTFLSDETTPTTLLSKSKTPPPWYMTKSGFLNLWVNPNARSRLEDTNANAWDRSIVPLDSKAALVTGAKHHN